MIRKIFNNQIIKEKIEQNLRYLEFNKLKELGVQNIYTLKNLDFDISDVNSQKDKNYLKLAQLFNIKEEEIIAVNQTHSNRILVIRNDEDLTKSRDNYDAIITNRKDIAISTRNADCILFAIYDKKKKVLANVHSGWKGTLIRMMEEILKVFQNEFKTDFKDISVFISPSIRYCHFEVAEDVKELFKNEFKEVDSNKYIKRLNVLDTKNGMELNRKYLIDTIFLNKIMMLKYGILEKNIYDSNICSICFGKDIHSYRGALEEDKTKRAVLITKIID